MLKEFYEKNYKLLFVIPVVILVTALIFIGLRYANTGDIMEKDVSLKGGITATIYSDKEFNIDNIKNELNKKLGGDISTRKLTDFSTKKDIGIIIEIGNIKSAEQLNIILEDILDIKLTKENYSIQQMGGSLGESFYKEMLVAMLIAFVLMMIVVFITFKSFIPSIAVVFAAFFDIVIALAVINILGLKVSTAGIAAFLLLIGYSVDTDVLMSTRVLKRKEGRVVDRMFDSAKTGLTMTITTIAAMIVGYTLSNSMVIKEIFLIILIGLLADIVSTYLGNGGILMWYMKKKGRE